MRDRYVTFVNYTKRQRLPKVLERAAKNLGSEGRRAEMLALLDNEDAVIDDSSWWPEGWGDWVRRLSGATVGQLNFFDYEFWFYAKILELSGYEKSPVDPFFMEKRLDTRAAIAALVKAPQRTIDFDAALRGSLKGNSADKSQLSTTASGAWDLSLDRLQTITATGTLCVVADNAGEEILNDLVLSAKFIEHGGDRVKIFIKNVPIFVSDFAKSDVSGIVEDMSEYGNENEIINSILKFVDSGDLEFLTDDYWSSPEFFDKIPGKYISDEAQWIYKGDLNYRRLIGDYCGDIYGAFEGLPVRPAVSAMAMRSIKSYCLAGLMRDEWPDALSTTQFPMDGTIFHVQFVPGKAA